ncbi:MAG TPA: cation:proton antiporter [Gemmataceae bacterium]|nr:cation:proton antiporter [Gemmataceae bacterium]
MDPAGLDAFRHLSVEEFLVPFLLQLAVILLAARAFAALGRRIGQPSVVGEIVAGLVLGPSLFGWLAPEAWQWLFRPTFAGVPHDLSDPLLARVIDVLSQLGLILLLFLVGLEFDFGHLRWHGPAALSISLTGIVVPFALGLGLAPLLHPHLEQHPEHGPIPAVGFALFLGVALSITAIPVLARIMMELSITRTGLGAITITAAAVDDALGWILLATVAAIVRTGFEPTATTVMIAETVGFVLAMIFVVRPLMTRWVRWVLRRGELGLDALAVLLAVLFGCSIVTGLIGIFAVFGAFLLGAVLSGEHEFREKVSAKLRDFVSGFLLPIFFTSTGLRTNIGSLGSPVLMLWGLAIFAAAVVGKFGGCALAARFGGFSRRESACIGAMMNTRGLMALVAINLGHELGVIPPSVFCILVLTALGTTMMTTPLLLRLMPGTELEPHVRKSGFAPPNPAPVAAGGTIR